MQVFSYQQIELATLWIEHLPNSEAVKNAFAVITPEERLTFCAAAEMDKDDWVTAINQAVGACVAQDDGTTVTMHTGCIAWMRRVWRSHRPGIPEPALPVFYDPVRLVKRSAKFSFRAHPFYKCGRLSHQRHLTPPQRVHL